VRVCGESVELLDITSYAVVLLSCTFGWQQTAVGGVTGGLVGSGLICSRYQYTSSELRIEYHTEYDEAFATQSQRDPPGAFQSALQKCHGTWSEKVYLVSLGRKLLVAQNMARGATSNVKSSFPSPHLYTLT